jgi:acyl-CoA hydrolase
VTRYTYDVVTHNGAGVHASDFRRCSDAKRCAERLAEKDATQRIKFGPFEIQRVEHTSAHSRRYWVRKRSRWVLWNPAQGIDERKPDWRYA